MRKRYQQLEQILSRIWSPTSFDRSDVVRYAMPRITIELQRGVATLSLAAMVFLFAASLLSALFNLGTPYIYTYGVLAALSLHIFLSSWGIAKHTELYLLGMVLLIVCGSSLVMVTQQTGTLDVMAFSSIAALFMLIPIVPWGLREASIIGTAIYLMFTVSMLTSHNHFTSQEFWVLQFLMLFAALISVTLVIRSLLVRKHDLVTQFNLQQTQNEMRGLLDRDHLTGAWNRRFLDSQFTSIVERHHAAGRNSYLAVLDIDRFKDINDTHGHMRGDQVLKAVYSAFAHKPEEDEYLVRMGGDEFALLFSAPDPAGRITEALTLIRNYIRAEDEDLPLYPTFSTGLLRIPPSSATSFAHAYKLADALSYEAKRAGGDRIVHRAEDVHAAGVSCVAHVALVR